MKPLNLILFCILHSAISIILADPVPLRFAADAETPRTFQASAYRGETLDIEARLLWRGAPLAVADGADAAMCWQTNGMGDAWWTAPASVTTGGVITATWSPSNDVGAASYRVFLRVAGTGGASYRANMLLRLVGSPGETPNALPLPVQVLDFSKIAWTNEPWSTSSSLSTNDVRAIVGEATAGMVVSNAFGSLDVVGTMTSHMAVGAPVVQADSVLIGANLLPAATMSDVAAATNGLAGVFLPQLWDDYYFAWEDNAYTGPVLYGSYAVALTVTDEHVKTIVCPDCIETPALYVDGSPAATGADLAAATNGLASAEEVAAARMESSLVYQLMMGSNVVAEVTNYNSSVRSPQLRLLQLEDGEYRTVWAETNGLSRTLQDANRHADDAVAELASRKADRAWGKYTSGMGAEAPSNTTWVSTPVTVIAGGYEYAKVITSAGEAWVLCSNGLNAGPDTNAYFRVATLDGESLFSIERSESVLIGVRAGGITSSGNTVSIPLDVVSAEAPVCYACDDLASQNWVNLAESLPSWVTSASASGSAGSWVWTIETTATKGFFQFRALQEGRTVIRNNAPAELSQGIWVNGSRYVPVANGSTLTWTLAQ